MAFSAHSQAHSAWCKSTITEAVQGLSKSSMEDLLFRVSGFREKV